MIAAMTFLISAWEGKAKQKDGVYFVLILFISM